MSYRRKKIGIPLLALVVVHFFTAQAVMAASMGVMGMQDVGAMAHCEEEQQMSSLEQTLNGDKIISDASTPDDLQSLVNCCDLNACFCVGVVVCKSIDTHATADLAGIYLPVTGAAIVELDYRPVLHPPQ